MGDDAMPSFRGRLVRADSTSCAGRFTIRERAGGRAWGGVFYPDDEEVILDRTVRPGGGYTLVLDDGGWVPIVIEGVGSRGASCRGLGPWPA
jgi:hypothetical protein